MARMHEFFRKVLELKSSDLHFSTGSHPMLRTDGELHPLPGFAVITNETAREWLHAPGAVSTVALLMGTARLAEPAVEALRTATAGDPDLRVLSWQETSPELASAIRIDDVGDYIFLAILLAIVALGFVDRCPSAGARRNGPR